MFDELSLGEIASIIIFFIGVYGVVSRRNIVKTIISISIMDMAVIMFFIADDISIKKSPIIKDTVNTAMIADPVPQALMITAIVIGVSVTAVALVMFINLYHSYSTTNWEKARKARGEE